jgi:hypothetical protein
MSTVMVMHWPEVTKEQYEEARKVVGWEREVPDGARAHVAWMGSDGFHVVDVWDSPEQFQSFVSARLTPGVQQIGIQGQPQVTFEEFLGAFVPEPIRP